MSHKPSAASLRRLRREGRAIRHAVAGTHVDPVVTTRLGDRLIVELFSGTGRFARACARHGFHATTLDVADSPLQDILNDDCFAGLVTSIRQRRVSFLWMAVPCATWSRARRPGLGPPQLRSDAYVMGFPDLKGASRRRVKMHNKILFRVAELVAECREHDVHYCIENPDSSRFWMSRPMLKIAAESFVVQLDFCQYGERWRKRTRLVTSCPALQQMERLCTSSGTYPNCSRTAKRHIQVSGIDARTGAFKTMLACPYPKPMVRRAASLLADFFWTGIG